MPFMYMLSYENPLYLLSISCLVTWLVFTDGSCIFILTKNNINYKFWIIELFQFIFISGSFNFTEWTILLQLENPNCHWVADVIFSLYPKWFETIPNILSLVYFQVCRELVLSHLLLKVMYGVYSVFFSISLYIFNLCKNGVHILNLRVLKNTLQPKKRWIGGFQ